MSEFTYEIVGDLASMVGVNEAQGIEAATLSVAGAGHRVLG